MGSNPVGPERVRSSADRAKRVSTIPRQFCNLGKEAFMSTLNKLKRVFTREGAPAKAFGPPTS